MRVFAFLDQPLRSHGHDLSVLASALASRGTQQDATAIVRAAVEDHADLRDARTLAIGPIFAQSAAMGGADSDLIYDGTLIDLKATARASPIGRDELYQLLGYLFADTDDHYRVTHVGFSALRRRRRCIWQAQEFVDVLAGSDGATLADRRSEFAELLAPMAELRQAQAGGV